MRKHGQETITVMPIQVVDVDFFYRIRKLRPAGGTSLDEKSKDNQESLAFIFYHGTKFHSNTFFSQDQISGQNDIDIAIHRTWLKSHPLVHKGNSLYWNL